MTQFFASVDNSAQLKLDKSVSQKTQLYFILEEISFYPFSVQN